VEFLEAPPARKEKLQVFWRLVLLEKGQLQHLGGSTCKEEGSHNIWEARPARKRPDTGGLQTCQPSNSFGTVLKGWYLAAGFGTILEGLNNHPSHNFWVVFEGWDNQNND
jgi:hypothetical protein